MDGMGRGEIALVGSRFLMRAVVSQPRIRTLWITRLVKLLHLSLVIATTTLVSLDETVFSTQSHAVIRLVGVTKSTSRSSTKVNGL